MKLISAAALLVLTLTGCASFLQNLSPGEKEKKFQEAAASLEQGKFREAREIYLSLAQQQTDSRRVEESKYNAASVLIHHKNPDKDYEQAGREFEAFAVRYPSSSLADSARSWAAMLKNFESTTADKLIRELSAARKSLEVNEAQLREARQQRDAAVKERESLAANKAGLTERVENLLNDKDSLLKEKSVLLKSKEELLKEKTLLEKRVDALIKEKETLLQAAEKLEKDLQDLKMVDIKMEKKRRKIRK